MLDLLDLPTGRGGRRALFFHGMIQMPPSKPSSVLTYGHQYGPYAFGVVSLLILWFAIMKPELDRNKIDYDRNEKIATQQAEIATHQETIAASMEKTATTLEMTAKILERTIDKMDRGGDVATH